jgi:hypothetical protein
MLVDLALVLLTGESPCSVDRRRRQRRGGAALALGLAAAGQRGLGDGLRLASGFSLDWR